MTDILQNMERTIDSLAEEIHKTAISKGFWDHEILFENYNTNNEKIVLRNPSIYPEKIALMHEELSEALREQRRGDEPKEEEELADCIIRILDYAAARDMSIGLAIAVKMNKNRDRPYLHGKKF